MQLRKERERNRLGGCEEVSSQWVLLSSLKKKEGEEGREITTVEPVKPEREVGMLRSDILLLLLLLQDERGMPLWKHPEEMSLNNDFGTGLESWKLL